MVHCKPVNVIMLSTDKVGGRGDVVEGIKPFMSLVLSCSQTN